MSIQLLLFVDERPSSSEYVRLIGDYIEIIKKSCPCQLEVIEIRKQPHLVEHFRLVATPALVKVSPGQKQILAGSNLISQLEKWWPQWKSLLERKHSNYQIEKSTVSKIGLIEYSAELIRLSDEVFRLKKEKKDLLDQLNFKDQVLAMLAHDLRSPLTATSIAIDTLEIVQDKEINERCIKLKKQLFSQIHNQLQIMNRLITDILQASKSINGELKVKRTEVFLSHLFRGIFRRYVNLLKEKSINLTQDIPKDIPGVYADEELIRQVVINLLDNAIKYTPENGQVTLSILHRTSQKVQVSISDTGPGIPKEKEERIFEGHFRLQRDQGKEGYGLGLSLCRKIIRVHYGQIWVDSVLGQGSCFHFTLPVYR
ncbi:MAG: histidine kinase [Candidatus Atelocyanobacterium thalassa]